jgi:hypothetical protein
MKPIQVKIKLSQRLINETLYHEDVWGSGGIVPLFLASAPDGGEWSASRPGRFTPGERAPGTAWIGGWVGCKAGLDAVHYITLLTPSENRNPPFQPVACRYPGFSNCTDQI